ncbi:ATP-dependent DNA helicase [Halobacillus yeomjeoni]|uniref:RecQ family ATP-dependent DNA helicase n=1 Tax=Halobacillus yeomjeoni TaxID=311194 RepID=UPI001CD2215F|nr:ATP-dependent DNA helicase RecQ [Halobacillus yeomjeoni]MCA0982988.1 ATP-dependent DNA helicase [Halobacillus yeomjeoni]
MQTHDLTRHLKENFGFSEFRDGQEAIIKDIMDGRDVLGILPTGTGKSLCYQLPSILLSGVTIVVSPLISLMVDQVKQLRASGFKSVTALNSFMDREERLAAMKNLNKFSLIYLSPEMLQNDWVKQSLHSIKVDLFVIDEAHCISQWGDEFRTDYLKLDQVIKDLNRPPVLALSATATPEVQKDIIAKLDCPDMKPHVYPMDRKNISFAVEQFPDPEDKITRIVDVLKQNFAPTMIYFSSRQWAEKVAFALQDQVQQRVAFYHGGMEQTDRVLVQQQFMNDQLDVICCTSAFGMGVDKPNIRLVIHFHFPPQLESFIQEVGRAGRDGEPCASLVLFTPKDHYLPQMLIQSELPEETDVSKVSRALRSYWKDGTNLPEDSAFSAEMELSESQWSFMKFQYEKYGIVEGRALIMDPSSAEIQQEIVRFMKERWTYKQNKLTEILQWIHQSGCRRESLYRSFQEHVREPSVVCCDACGFKVEELCFKENQVSYISQSWEDRLKAVFGQGGSYDA